MECSERPRPLAAEVQSPAHYCGHGSSWLEFFAAFVAVLAAIRVLIAWTYTRTGSLRMAQLLHASSTGFLVILSAPRVTPPRRPSGTRSTPPSCGQWWSP